MERIKQVWIIFLMFLYVVIYGLAYCINTCFNLMPYYLRNIFSCFINCLKILAAKWLQFHYKTGNSCTYATPENERRKTVI